MRTLRLLSILCLVGVLIVFARVPVPAAAEQASQAGTINGTLVNRTPGGAGVGNAAITLLTYNGTTEEARATTKSDDQGRFRFTGLNNSAEYNYALSVVYQDAEYMTDPRRFDQSVSEMAWEVAVYDATPNSDKIRIGRGHFIVDVRDGSLWVLQFYSYVNSGDKTYVGAHTVTDDGRKATLRLSLPAGAQDITAQEGLDECCAFRTDEGISDTLAVPPGGRSIVLSYELPYNSSDVYLDLPVYYPVDSLNLLVSEGKAKVASKQLQPQEAVEMGGKRYTHLAGANLPGDTELSIDITGLGGAASPVGEVLRPENLRWGAIGVAVLAIAFVLFYALRGNRTAVPVPAGPQRPASRDVLLRELAELDDRFATGQLDEDKYERLREDKKRRLKELAPTTEEQGEEPAD